METINSLISVLNSNQSISTNEMFELLYTLATKYNTLKHFDQLIEKLTELNYSSLDKENICKLVDKLVELNDEKKFEFKLQNSGKHTFKLEQIQELNSNDLIDISACHSQNSWIVSFAKVIPEENNVCAVQIIVY
jgi:hypothetical protein